MLSSRSLAMYNYYESKTLSQTEDRSRKDSIIEVVLRVEPIGGGLIVMMLAGGASSGAVAGVGVHVSMDVERQIEVGAVGDCAGAGSGDAPDAVDAGEHGPPGVGLAPSAHLGPRLPGNARRCKSSELVDVGATLSKGTKGGAKNGAQRLEPKRKGPEASVRGGIIHQRPVELAGFLLVVLLELGLAVLGLWQLYPCD